ncbi:hypothetical protein CRG98_002554 [Punica granatum]|uniref:Uncharacterized protein n=1 Tax=Punica granatum TaxID=22663 RepID=A0A2I0L8N2_PUNGR|nr:hypothetical protein CRG98_002554 [Punica granatum]
MGRSGHRACVGPEDKGDGFKRVGKRTTDPGGLVFCCYTDSELYLRVVRAPVPIFPTQGSM